jgi:hypothetical protein
MTAKGAEKLKEREAENGAAPIDPRKAALLAEEADTETEEVDVPGVGTVTVRGLNRDEAYLVAGQKGGVRAKEVQMVTIGLVDPAMTFKEVEQMFKRRKAGTVQAIIDKINELSGMEDDSRKEAMATFLGEE